MNKFIKKFALCFVMCCFLHPLMGVAQNVTIDVSIDSLQRLIGEQARIKLEVGCDASQKVQLPIFTDTIVTGVEVIDIAKADTQYLNNRERMLITQEYIITSFDSAAYYLPPFEVMVDGQPYQSKSLALMVYPMEIDSENPEAIFGPKDIMQLPLSWNDWKGVVWKFILLMVLVGAVIYLIIRYRDNKPIIRKVKVEPKLPPHQQAIIEIERIKEEKNWQKGDPKVYYTELTDVIRIYIRDRFGYNAMEKTSAEIIEYLQENKDKDAIEDLKQLFLTADLVKFAKYAPLLNENDMNLMCAIDFINQTKIEVDPNEKPMPTEITVEEKRSRRAKTLLVLGITVLALLVLFVGFYMGYDIYNLFF